MTPRIEPRPPLPTENGRPVPALPRRPYTLGVVAAAGGAFSPEGPAAREIAFLWWLMLALGCAVFVIFAVLLGLALRRGRGNTTLAAMTPAARRRWLVGGGVVMPAVILVIVLVATVETMADIPNAGSPDALKVEIVGHQWWWEVRYPDGGVTTANEIHIPVGRPVEFILTSADVIHSFWVPQLGGKLDLLPEDINTLVLQADKAATYRSQCAEFCGLEHAKMGFVLIAEPADEFATWLADQARPAAEPTTAVARDGQELFASSGCIECHAIRGTAATGTGAPDLTHFASRQTLTAALLPNDRTHLADWILEPTTVKEGDMRPADISGDDLDALITYLESLK